MLCFYSFTKPNVFAILRSSGCSLGFCHLLLGSQPQLCFCCCSCCFLVAVVKVLFFFRIKAHFALKTAVTEQVNVFV